MSFLFTLPTGHTIRSGTFSFGLNLPYAYIFSLRRSNRQNIGGTGVIQGLKVPNRSIGVMLKNLTFSPLTENW